MLKKQKIKYGFFNKFFLVVFLLSINLFAFFAFSNDVNEDYTSEISPISVPPQIHYATPFFSIDALHSKVLGSYLNAKLIQKLNGNNAIRYELDYGKNENRINLTWGKCAHSTPVYEVYC